MALREVESLVGDLRVDRKRVTDLVAALGVQNAARVLGYDTSSYDNLRMSGRLALAALRKRAPTSVTEYAERLRPQLGEEVYRFFLREADFLSGVLMPETDLEHDWFSANTLISTYLARDPAAPRDLPIELPHFMWLRVAAQLYLPDRERVAKAYREMAEGRYVPASPTLFNAGTKRPQMSSCFVAGTLVGTERGPVPIEEVRVGDRVVTRSGAVGEVSQLHVNPRGERKIWRLSCEGTRPLLVTEDHRFWARKSGEFSWVAAADLTPDFFLAVPERKEEEEMVFTGAVFLSAVRRLLTDDLEGLVSSRLFSWTRPLLFAVLTQARKQGLQRVGPRSALSLFFACRAVGATVLDPEGNFLPPSSPGAVRVLSAEESEERPEVVYTLGVEGDHSYGAEGVVAENCFLMSIEDDLESILYTLADGGMISKASGGLGIDVSLVRHSGIGFFGESSGVVPMLGIYNAMVKYVNQGGRRKGAATIYLRPFHIDVLDFIAMVDTVGDSAERNRDLDICLWVPWLFWQRVREDGNWTLFCPTKTPLLNRLYGREFEAAYLAAERDPEVDPRHRRTIKARHLLARVRDMQRKRGMPYIMHADACNLKSNQRNQGYIRCGNLCTEIVEYTDEDNLASCNLSSLSLRFFARRRATEGLPLTDCYDFSGLAEATRSVTFNLNRLIDGNWYPLDRPGAPGRISRTNLRSRPIGIGVSGLADALHILDIPFDDDRAGELDEKIFACLYFNALLASLSLAVEFGPYETFSGSPLSEGKFQFDLWREEFQIRGPNPLRKESDDDPLPPSAWGQEPFSLPTGEVVGATWEDLRRAVTKYGVRNSLLLALMPTASTAQILRNCESVEAHQSNLYSRKVLSAAYPVVNRFLLADLEELGLWNSVALDYLRVKRGSVAGLTSYLEEFCRAISPGERERLLWVERKYKTMWELRPRLFLERAARRGRYICQSQSTNVYMAEPTNEKIEALHLLTDWLGLKTGMYYLRQNPPVETLKFTVDPELVSQVSDFSAATCTAAECLSCQ